MTRDEPDDDDDWYAETSADESEDDARGRCPECGRSIWLAADRCPGCGYWLLESDRRATASGGSLPAWIKATALVLLLGILFVIVTVVNELIR